MKTIIIVGERTVLCGVSPQFIFETLIKKRI